MDRILPDQDNFGWLSGLVWMRSKTKIKSVFSSFKIKVRMGNKSIDFLGLKLSMNVTDTIDLHYKPIFQYIQNALKHSKRRKLTPIGQLVV